MSKNFGKLGEAFVELEVDLRKAADTLRNSQGAINKLGTEIGAQLDKSIAAGLTLKTTQQQFQQLGSKLQNIGDVGSRVGRSLSIGVTAPLVGMAAASLKFSTDFNAAMANVATLIPGNTARVLELKEAVQDMARETGKSTGDLADGLFQVISAFGDSAQSAQVLEINAKAAAAGLATTTDAINLTSAVTKGYGDTTAAAVQKVADLAFKTNELGQTTFPELAASMGRVVPIAATLNVSQEELFASFATLTGVTGNAAEVSTQLTSVLSGMLKPTTEMSAAIAALGFSGSEAMVQQLGLVGSLEALIGTTDGSAESVGKLLGRKEALTAALAITGEQADTFSEKLEKMGDVSGAVDSAFREQSEGVNKLGFQLSQAQQRIVTTGQRLGDALAPALLATLDLIEPLAGFLEKAVQIFADAPAPIQGTTIAFLGLAAAAGPLVFIASSIAGNLGLLITAMSGTAAGAAILGKGLAAAKIAFGLFASAAFGAVAAASALGIGIGMLLNKFEGVRNAADAVTSRIIANTAAGRRAAEANDELADAVEGLRRRSVELGLDIRRGPNESLEEYQVRLGRAVQETIRQREEVAATTPVIQENTEAVEEDAFAAQQAALAAEEAARAKEEFREKVQGLKDELLGIKRPTDEFLAALRGLSDDGQLTGDVINRVADEVMAMSESTDPLIMRLRELIPLMNIPPPGIGLKELNKQLRETQKEAGLTIAMLDAVWDIPAPPDPGDLPLVDAGKVVRDAQQSFDDAAESIQETEERIVALRDAGYSTEQIIAIMGREIDQARSSAEQWGLGIGEATHAIIVHQDEIERSRESAKRWERVWTQAVGRVVDDFASGVADMIFAGKGFAIDLKNIFTDLGKALIKIMITDTFTKIAGKLGGLLSGITGGGLFGSIGRSIGGALGGTAASSIPAVAGTTAGTAAGGTAAGAAAGGAGAAGLFTGLSAIPVFGAIAAGAILGITKIGKGRKTADKLTDPGGLQFEFDQALAKIVDTKDEMLAAGTLTAEGAMDAKTSVEALWATFSEEAASFAEQGATQAKVVGQAFETLNPIVDQILSDMAMQAEELQRSPIESTSADGGSAPDGPVSDRLSGIAESIGTAFERFDAGVSGLTGKLDSLTGSLTSISDRVEDLSSLAGAEFSPTFHLNFENEFNFTEEVDPVTVRDQIIPEITTQLETAGRGVLDRWAQLLRDAEDGLAAAATA